ncbi:hypothetical protein RhiirA4_464774 [Rhizophagus irregularis]|uniref:Uncharacterized protein n=1 Tax=Rhizophagus irregularis TaxID=588596 RepID=A0A2I1GR37_9GLOM|nr:hypothetical protein RhiirA4_464774 [Rhizophagus irregularis]
MYSLGSWGNFGIARRKLRTRLWIIRTLSDPSFGFVSVTISTWIWIGNGYYRLRS